MQTISVEHSLLIDKKKRQKYLVLGSGEQKNFLFFSRIHRLVHDSPIFKWQLVKFDIIFLKKQ